MLEEGRRDGLFEDHGGEKGGISGERRTGWRGDGVDSVNGTYVSVLEISKRLVSGIHLVSWPGT